MFMIPGYARVYVVHYRRGKNGELLGIEEDYVQRHQKHWFPEAYWKRNIST